MSDHTESNGYFDEGLGVAIIGMAGRFPGSDTIDTYWENLCQGRETISRLTDEELKARGVSQAELSDPNYVKAASALDEIEFFDASFFDYAPAEAAIMDPQQRLFLECTWQALEHAGYAAGENDAGSVGVFVGAKMSTYLGQVLSSEAFAGTQDTMQIALGNDLASLSTRISYKLNLGGPSYAVQTACSTSLVAVHLACQSLLLDECRMALAGAVAIDVPHRVGYRYQYGGILSPDGHCRPFDARAQGTVFGSGIGVVVLKRLSDALADGDRIYAVIRGSATNNDGSLKASFTAPSVEGQTRVIMEALACSGVDVDTITYVEAHGTGTALGDPIEIVALTNAFRVATARTGFCRIGSVKGNMGHLDAAAGMAGLIKTVLALERKMIPPSLYFEQPHPEIDFERSPFFVNTALAEWETDGAPRRAGVSSFGFGGTNTHVVLEEAPPGAPSGPARPAQLLVLSAKTRTALDMATANLAACLAQQPDLNLADVAYTLHTGRRAFGHRRVVVCRDPSDAARLLESPDSADVLTGVVTVKERPVVFMFPGQGAQYVGMARDLYDGEPLFRQHVDRCVGLLEPHLGLDLRTILYPTPTQAEAAARQLEQTAIAQPALFVVEYALAQLWMSWGIVPQAMIGHSVGEYVAACLAGVFDLEDALTVVAARGRLMQEMPPGAMLSVSLPEQDVLALLGNALSLAASNSPALCVASGPERAIAQLEERLEQTGDGCRRLHTSHAFHSEMMEPLLSPFAEIVKKSRRRPPTIPYLSNVTGTWITDEQAVDPGYWASHARQTVRFADGIQTVLKEPDRILLEVGPGRTLSTFARQQVASGSNTLALSSVRHPQQTEPDNEFLLTTLGKLWLAGEAVDWQGFYAHERRRRLPLPTYPFERQRYWIEGQGLGRAGLGQVSKGKAADVSDWFFVPSWEQAPLPIAEKSETRRWLVFVDRHGLGATLIERLRTMQHTVVTVESGAAFESHADGAYVLNPQRQADYIALLQQLKEKDLLPDVIAHLWSLTGKDVLSTPTTFEQMQNVGYYSLLFLAQALAQESPEQTVKIGMIADGLHQVSGEEETWPEKATLLGPCAVVPQEHGNLSCACIDIMLPEPGSRRGRKLVEALIGELTAATPDMMVAYRGDRRWVQTFAPAPLGRGEKESTPRRILREGGVYLITGGLGNVGYAIGQYLAQAVHARLALTGRSGLPPRERWEQILAENDRADSTVRGIQRVQTLEALGAEVMVIQADVADAAQMGDLVAQIDRRWGRLDGVLHAAGVTSGPSVYRPLTEMGCAESEIQFRPKAQGTYVLENVLADRELDFCLLFSSSATLFGGLGYVTYAAANAFMDAFAIQRSRTGTIPWISVNWDPWPGDVDGYESTQTSLGRYTMTEQEALEAFRRVVCLAEEGQVAVVTGDLPARLDLWIKRSGRQQSVTMHERPDLVTDYTPPRNETERKIAEIWSRMLGIEQVGIHDDFFELGGHSLLITQVINDVRQTFKIELPVRSLFEHTTVAGIAQLIDSGGGRETGLDDPLLVEHIRTAFPTERIELLKTYLRHKIALALNIGDDRLPEDGNLAEIDMDSVSVDLMLNLKQDFKIQLFPQEISRVASIEAFARLVKVEIDRVTDPSSLATNKPLSFYTLQPYRKRATGISQVVSLPKEKNAPVAFVHSSPRAGSTLLRVMLAGHPDLFCPPELHLLYFSTMQEWQQNLGFGDEFAWTGKGLEWAFVDLMGIEADESQAHIADLVEKDEPIYHVYKQLQALTGNRLLIDKTPTYSLDMETLERAEKIFESPKYIHLVRHPYAVIESFLRIRLDRLFGPNIFQEPDADPYIVAETVWAVANRNLLQFLEGIPPDRHYLLRFEDMMSNPRETMTSLCQFLGVPFHEAVLNPYDGRRERMTGGLGDPNIFQHRTIDTSLGEAWRKIRLPRLLDDSTVALATQLSYELVETSQSAEKLLAEDELLANLDQLSGEQVATLLSQMLAEEQ